MANTTITSMVVAVDGKFGVTNKKIEILDLLYFEGIFGKEKSIDIGNEHKTTCSQILAAKASGDTESAFHKWAESNQPLFWVNGRPGCGKSTLMKYAFYHDKEMQKRLERWAGGDWVMKVTVSLLEDGTQPQKSHEGILRSTLYQILSRRKDLISAAFPTFFRGPWPPLAPFNTIVNLTQGLWGVFAQEAHRLRLVVFIDGLDSYRMKDEQLDAQEEKALLDQSTDTDEGDRKFDAAERALTENGYREIAELVKSMADQERIKLCVSSRELPVFSEAFQGVPNLHVQDQYEKAIVKYCAGRLEEEAPNLAEVNLLSHEVAQKSQGNMIWAKFAMDILLERSLKAVRPTLQALPDHVGGTDGLYMHMLQANGPNQQRAAASIFRIMARTLRASIIPPSLLNIAFALEGYMDEDGELRVLNDMDRTFTHTTLQELGERMARHIQTCCLQLLRIEGSPLEPGQRVIFTDPAAKDFATRPVVCAKLLGDTAVEFPSLIDFDLSLLSSHIRLVQCFQPGVLRPFMQTASYDRPQVCPEAWVLIVGALRLAGRIESELREDDHGRRRVYMTLLRHLDLICQKLWAKSLQCHQPIFEDENWKKKVPILCRQHWAGFEPMERGKSPKRNSFLTLAIQANLIIYVSTELERLARALPTNDEKSAQMEDLLRAAVVPAGPRSNAVPASNALTDDYRALHVDFPVTVLAETVLQQGRDALDLRSTSGAKIWAGLIRARRHYFSRQWQARGAMERLLTSPGTAGLQRNQERWATAVKWLLVAGADPQMPIASEGEGAAAASANRGYEKSKTKPAAALIRETLILEPHFAAQLKDIESFIARSKQDG